MISVLGGVLTTEFFAVPHSLMCSGSVVNLLGFRVDDTGLTVRVNAAE